MRRLAYCVAGDIVNPVVVLLHAIGLDSSFWVPQIQILRERHRVISIDIPGHGASDPIETSLNFQALADDVCAVLDQESVKSAHMVGLSLGGMIAQHVALVAPARVQTLALVDTAATLSPEGREATRQRGRLTEAAGMKGILLQTMERWFTETGLSEKSEEVSRVQVTLLNSSPAVHAAYWRLISTLDTLDDLPRITCPVLVVVGEKDTTTPPAASKIIAQAVPTSTLALLPGQPHMGMIEAPEICTRPLLGFLNEHGLR